MSFRLTVRCGSRCRRAAVALPARRSTAWLGAASRTTRVPPMCSSERNWDGSSRRSLSRPTRATSDWFGFSSAVDGNTILIGAFSSDGVTADTGAAYVFDRTASGWVGSAKLVASDGSTGDRFGRSVAIDGDVIVIGAPQRDDSGFSSGAAYIFGRAPSGWVEAAKPTASDADAYERLWRRCRASGNHGGRRATWRRRRRPRRVDALGLGSGLPLHHAASIFEGGRPPPSRGSTELMDVRQL